MEERPDFSARAGATGGLTLKMGGESRTSLAITAEPLWDSQDPVNSHQSPSPTAPRQLQPFTT